MTASDDSLSEYLWRTQWRERAFKWLRDRQYADLDLDSCIESLNENPTRREPALAAFWGAYMGSELPPVLSDEQDQRIGAILRCGLSRDSRSGDIRDLAFVKLHLAGLRAICLIDHDWPVAADASVAAILEEALYAYQLAKQPEIDTIIENPSGWGNRYFYDNLFVFSSALVGGIACLERAFWRLEQRDYERAFWDITNGAWDICATIVEDLSGELRRFEPYLPHSGKRFNIQEAADIFEEVKRHSKKITNWEYMQMACDAIQSLSHDDLYDWLESITDADGETYAAMEYWGRAAAYAEAQKCIVGFPIPVLTRDVIERMETKERLKRDFFGDLWEQMSEEAQEILLDVEVEWIHHRPDKMAREIRPLLELILRAVFPFLEHTVEQSDARLILTRMKDALRTNKVVRASIVGLRIGVHDKEWIRDELPGFLQRVIHIRNYFEKEQHLPGRKSREYLKMVEMVTTIRSELLGIGCRGVLPRLMRAKQSAHTSE